MREIDRVQSRANSFRVTGYDRGDNRMVVVVDRRDGDVIDVRRRWH